MTETTPNLDHERIWLEPECCADTFSGRTWCQDNVFEDCEEGREPTEYVRADLLTTLSDKAAKADLSVVAYARALEKMRQMLAPVHDDLEDEGDRVYLGSTNHADLIHDAWHLADALHWDEILADTQPKTPLAEINLKLQAEIKELSDKNAKLVEALKQAALDLHEAAGRFACIGKVDAKGCSEVTRECARRADAVVQSLGGSHD